MQQKIHCEREVVLALLGMRLCIHKNRQLVVRQLVLLVGV